MPPRRSRRKASASRRSRPSDGGSSSNAASSNASSSNAASSNASSLNAASSNASSLNAASSNAASSNGMERIDGLFNKYANSSSGMIDPNGIEKLCSDLGVCHTDVKILVFAWKLKAANQGFLTQAEWRTGLRKLGVDSLDELRLALRELEIEVGEPSNYKDFYSYAFRYCLTEEKHKCLEVESVCDVLNIVLGPRFRAQVDSLTEYLKDQSDYKVINLDQWNSFLPFCQEISFPDLGNYDASQPWPVILDNFVKWMQEKNR